MQTIVLNADYTYLNTVPWRRAIKLIIKEKAEVIHATDKQVTNYNRTYSFKIPLILKLIKMVNTVYRNKVPFSKKNVFIRDNYCCAYCGKQENLSVDHIIPSSKGGKTNFENCVTSCVTCNVIKGDKTLEEAGLKLKKLPYEPSIMEFLAYRMKFNGAYDFLRGFNIY